MPFLIAAVVFVGVLCLLNLVLTLGVLRRLREHTAELERLAGQRMFLPYDPAVLVGRSLPEALTGARLVGFFDVDCSTCHEKAPRFAAAAKDEPALAIVTGSASKVGDLLEVVGGTADVITGEDAGLIAHALGVEAFPTFLRATADGTIEAADTELAALGSPATAP
ncbi:hypothetical protein [Nonomuraea sp. NPDC050310]|uniref:hypothetical protein n=1 Tax=unclassified Nonomuraea TaxID=2593643 RepID=UPI0033D97882